MTFLVDADVPRSAADVVRRHGYQAVQAMYNGSSSVW
jgi:hypothetical protein